MVVVTLLGGVCSGLGAVVHALCTHVAIFDDADMITFQNISSKYLVKVFLGMQSESNSFFKQVFPKLLEQLAYHINVKGNLQAG